MAPIPLLGLKSGDAIVVSLGPQTGVNYAGSLVPTITVALVGTGSVQVETNSTLMMDGTAQVPNPNSWNPLRKISIDSTVVVNLNPTSVPNWIRVTLVDAGTGTCEITTQWQQPGQVVDPSIYLGPWNANTNTPTIVNGVGLRGAYYLVVVPGNAPVDGNSLWQFGDRISFNGAAWVKTSVTDEIGTSSGAISSGSGGTPFLWLDHI